MAKEIKTIEDILIFDEADDSYQNGMIALGDDFANVLGFTEDKFSGYLWRPETINEEDKHITISLITSKKPGHGNLIALFDKIKDMGYSIVVPTPSNRMEAICAEYGFQHKVLHDPDMGRLDALYYETQKKEA